MYGQEMYLRIWLDIRDVIAACILIISCNGITRPSNFFHPQLTALLILRLYKEQNYTRNKIITRTASLNKQWEIK
jgi:hypothetical protein